jgi:hypothetical protein
MQTAYIHFIKYSLAKQCTISVFDGEEWQVKRSTGLKAIMDAVKSVEEADLRVRDSDDNVVGWAKVSAYGLEPEETMMDWSVEPFMDAWDEAYQADTQGN